MQTGKKYNVGNTVLTVHKGRVSSPDVESWKVFLLFLLLLKSSKRIKDKEDQDNKQMLSVIGKVGNCSNRGCVGKSESQMFSTTWTNHLNVPTRQIRKEGDLSMAKNPSFSQGFHPGGWKQNSTHLTLLQLNNSTPYFSTLFFPLLLPLPPPFIFYYYLSLSLSGSLFPDLPVLNNSRLRSEQSKMTWHTISIPISKGPYSWVPYNANWNLLRGLAERKIGTQITPHHILFLDLLLKELIPRV